MKATVFHEHGAPEVLKYEDFPDPEVGPNAVTNVNLLFWKQLEILGSTMRSRSELRDVLKLVWNGKLQPVVDRVFPLSKAQEAHEILEKGEQFGKLVLNPCPT